MLIVMWTNKLGFTPKWTESQDKTNKQTNKPLIIFNFSHVSPFLLYVCGFNINVLHVLDIRLHMHQARSILVSQCVPRCLFGYNTDGNFQVNNH